jgi:hypothetical protein
MKSAIFELVGKQAMFGHDPPMRPRSSTTVRRPSVALVQAGSISLMAPDPLLHTTG